MKNFNWTKYLIATLVVYVAYQLFDFIIHSIILGGRYEELNDAGIFREDMESKMWVMFITAAFFAIFFVYLFHYFSNAYKNGWKSGLYFGLIVAFLMIIPNIYEQYSVYPVPYDLVWQWVLYGIIKFGLLGLLAGLLYKPKAAAA